MGAAGRPVLITNPGFTTWYVWQNTNNAALAVASAVQAALQIAQMVIYYGLADDATDRRDAIIQKQLDFNRRLQDYKLGVDWDMALLKSSVLTDLELPLVEMCSLSTTCTPEIMNDGVAVDTFSETIVNSICKGAPTGWGMHDGSITAAKAASSAGGLIANNARRGREDFQQRKTDLVRAAQQGMKSVITASDINTKYTQAVAIQQGLADLFMSGFNSAASGLGVSLGRLAGSGGGSPVGTAGAGGIGSGGGNT